MHYLLHSFIPPSTMPFIQIEPPALSSTTTITQISFTSTPNDLALLKSRPLTALDCRIPSLEDLVKILMSNARLCSSTISLVFNCMLHLRHFNIQ